MKALALDNTFNKLFECLPVCNPVSGLNATILDWNLVDIVSTLLCISRLHLNMTSAPISWKKRKMVRSQQDILQCMDIIFKQQPSFILQDSGE